MPALPVNLLRLAEHAYSLELRHQPCKKAMIGWAVEVLMTGGDGREVTLLAGADHWDDSEVVATFRKAAAEQGVQLPEHNDEFSWLERCLSRQILNHDIPPLKALSELWHLWHRSNYSEVFHRWGMLSEAVSLIDDGYSFAPFEHLTKATVNQTILEEAARRVRGE